MVEKTNGYHYLCELFDCEVSKIDNCDFLRKILLSAIKNTSLIALHNYFYKFSPQGVTGFVLLSTSHISVHTWPEHKYVAFDVFSCGDNEDTLRVVESICNEIGFENRTVNLILRGYNV